MSQDTRKIVYGVFVAVTVTTITSVWLWKRQKKSNRATNNAVAILQHLRHALDDGIIAQPVYQNLADALMSKTLDCDALQVVLQAFPRGSAARGERLTALSTSCTPAQIQNVESSSHNEFVEAPISEEPSTGAPVPQSTAMIQNPAKDRTQHPRTKESTLVKSPREPTEEPKLNAEIVYMFADPLVFSDRRHAQLVIPVAPLHYDNEWRELEAVLAETGKSIIFRVRVGNAQAFNQVTQSGCDVLHFSCHGHAVVGLLLEGEGGESHASTANGVRKVLGAIRQGSRHAGSRQVASDKERRRGYDRQRGSVTDSKVVGEPKSQAKTQRRKRIGAGRGRGLPRLVVVTSCHSEQVGRAFLAAGVEHVIAIRQDEEVKDKVAVDFMKAFYTNLLLGQTVKSAFHRALGVLELDTLRNAKEREEVQKFLLLPQPGTPSGRESGKSRGQSGMTISETHHEVSIFQALPRGTLCPSKPPAIEVMPSSRFVGRRIDMYRVFNAMLQMPLVTLTGGIAIGKTELAKAIGAYAGMRRPFQGNVRFVRLELTDSPEAVLWHIEQVLGVNWDESHDSVMVKAPTPMLTGSNGQLPGQYHAARPGSGPGTLPDRTPSFATGASQGSGGGYMGSNMSHSPVDINPYSAPYGGYRQPTDQFNWQIQAQAQAQAQSQQYLQASQSPFVQSGATVQAGMQDDSQARMLMVQQGVNRLVAELNRTRGSRYATRQGDDVGARRGDKTLLILDHVDDVLNSSNTNRQQLQMILQTLALSCHKYLTVIVTSQKAIWGASLNVASSNMYDEYVVKVGPLTRKETAELVLRLAPGITLREAWNSVRKLQQTGMHHGKSEFGVPQAGDADNDVRAARLHSLLRWRAKLEGGGASREEEEVLSDDAEEEDEEGAGVQASYFGLVRRQEGNFRPHTSSSPTAHSSGHAHTAGSEDEDKTVKTPLEGQEPGSVEPESGAQTPRSEESETATPTVAPTAEVSAAPSDAQPSQTPTNASGDAVISVQCMEALPILDFVGGHPAEVIVFASKLVKNQFKLSELAQALANDVRALESQHVISAQRAGQGRSFQSALADNVDRLQRENPGAYFLFLLLSLLPSGAMPMDLDHIWDPRMCINGQCANCPAVFLNPNASQRAARCESTDGSNLGYACRESGGKHSPQGGFPPKAMSDRSSDRFSSPGTQDGYASGTSATTQSYVPVYSGAGPSLQSGPLMPMMQQPQHMQPPYTGNPPPMIVSRPLPIRSQPMLGVSVAQHTTYDPAMGSTAQHNAYGMPTMEAGDVSQHGSFGSTMQVPASYYGAAPIQPVPVHAQYQQSFAQPSMTPMTTVPHSYGAHVATTLVPLQSQSPFSVPSMTPSISYPMQQTSAPHTSMQWTVATTATTPFLLPTTHVSAPQMTQQQHVTHPQLSHQQMHQQASQQHQQQHQQQQQQQQQEYMSQHSQQGFSIPSPATAQSAQSAVPLLGRQTSGLGSSAHDLGTSIEYVSDSAPQFLSSDRGGDMPMRTEFGQRSSSANVGSSSTPHFHTAPSLLPQESEASLDNAPLPGALGYDQDEQQPSAAGDHRGVQHAALEDLMGGALRGSRALADATDMPAAEGPDVCSSEASDTDERSETSNDQQQDVASSSSGGSGPSGSSTFPTTGQRHRKHFMAGASRSADEPICVGCGMPSIGPWRPLIHELRAENLSERTELPVGVMAPPLSVYLDVYRDLSVPPEGGEVAQGECFTQYTWYTTYARERLRLEAGGAYETYFLFRTAEYMSELLRVLSSHASNADHTKGMLARHEGNIWLLLKQPALPQDKYHAYHHEAERRRSDMDRLRNTSSDKLRGFGRSGDSSRLSGSRFSQDSLSRRSEFATATFSLEAYVKSQTGTHRPHRLAGARLTSRLSQSSLSRRNSIEVHSGSAPPGVSSSSRGSVESPVSDTFSGTSTTSGGARSLVDVQTGGADSPPLILAAVSTDSFELPPVDPPSFDPATFTVRAPMLSTHRTHQSTVSTIPEAISGSSDIDSVASTQPGQSVHSSPLLPAFSTAEASGSTSTGGNSSLAPAASTTSGNESVVVRQQEQMMQAMMGMPAPSAEEVQSASDDEMPVIPSLSNFAAGSITAVPNAQVPSLSGKDPPAAGLPSLADSVAVPLIPPLSSETSLPTSSADVAGVTESSSSAGLRGVEALLPGAWGGSDAQSGSVSQVASEPQVAATNPMSMGLQTGRDAGFTSFIGASITSTPAPMHLQSAASQRSTAGSADMSRTTDSTERPAPAFYFTQSTIGRIAVYFTRLLRTMGRRTDARRAADTGHSVCDRLGDTYSSAQLLREVASFAELDRNIEGAIAIYRRAIELLRASPHRLDFAEAVLDMFESLLSTPGQDPALPEERLLLLDARGIVTNRPTALTSNHLQMARYLRANVRLLRVFARLSFLSKDYQHADKLQREALQILDTYHWLKYPTYRRVQLIQERAQVLMQLNRATEALEQLASAEQICKSRRLASRHRGDVLWCMGDVHLHRRSMYQARKAFRGALRVFQELDDTQAMVELQKRLAVIEDDRQSDDQSRAAVMPRLASKGGGARRMSASSTDTSRLDTVGHTDALSSEDESESDVAGPRVRRLPRRRGGVRDLMLETETEEDPDTDVPARPRNRLRGGRSRRHRGMPLETETEDDGFDEDDDETDIFSDPRQLVAIAEVRQRQVDRTQLGVQSLRRKR